jgi:hypothetical protein
MTALFRNDGVRSDAGDALHARITSPYSVTLSLEL